jgi:hypothetical protein
VSTFHYAIYGGLGLSLVLISVWRLTSSGAGGVRLTGLVLGFVILGVVGSSLIGIVSVADVEACLNKRPGGRSKLITCLAEVHWAR